MNQPDTPTNRPTDSRAKNPAASPADGPADQQIGTPADPPADSSAGTSAGSTAGGSAGGTVGATAGSSAGAPVGGSAGGPAVRTGARQYRRNPKRRGVKLLTVQRWVAAVIFIHIVGSAAIALAAYAPHMEQIKHSSGVGLWVMSGVVGLATAAGVLLIHGRSVLSPWLIPGVLPIAISAFYVF